jgi:hypothetical protein
VTFLQRSALSCLAVLSVTHVFAGSARAKPSGGGQNQQSADHFWRAFRAAVVVRDTSAITGMTKFPFVVRWGNADPNDPRVEFRRDQFQAILDHLLALPVPGLDGKTMTQAVAETEKVRDPDIRSGSFMIQSFEFFLVKGGWRWTAAFTDDPFFYKADADETLALARADPLRKLALDVTSEVAHLKRPLTVKHMRATPKVAYLEAQEPGKNGRIVRAFLHREQDDPQGQMVWAVKDWSFQPVGGGADDWTARIDKLVASGVPASLFPARGASAEEEKSHAR